jgi:hypothetical protein
MKLAIHLHPMLKLRMSEAIPLLPYVPPCCGQGKLHLFTSFDIVSCYEYITLVPDALNTSMKH